MTLKVLETIKNALNVLIVISKSIEFYLIHLKIHDHNHVDVMQMDLLLPKGIYDRLPLIMSYLIDIDLAL